MKNASDKFNDRSSLRNRIIGLGEKSLKKSYYPQLQEKIENLEKNREILEDAISNAETQQKMFRILFDNASDGIVLFDKADYSITMCNRTFSGMIRADDNNCSSLTIYDIHPEDSIPHILDELERISSGEIKIARDIPVKGFDGTISIVDISGTPVEFNNKVYLICILRDMTAIRQAEIEKAELEARVSHSQKMQAIGTLAGGVAHDFNNILSAIMGNIELSIRHSSPDSGIIKYLDSVMKACYRARDIVSQLLTICYNGENKLVPIKLLPVIKESIKLVRSTISSTVSIQTVNKATVDTARADSTQISQIILNLCTNAAQAMPDMNGEIRIDLNNRYLDSNFLKTHPNLSEGWYFQIDVTDNGSGITPEIQKKIFDPFFTTKERGKGTGLGLSVIHGIVESHNGSISVYSEPGRGTKFRVYIPLTGDEIPADQANSEIENIPHASILLVDDEVMLTEVNCEMLENMGHSVTVCNDSIEALSIFRHNNTLFDLVITDMAMPGMTGIALAKEIQSIRPGIPIIICTGFNEQLDDNSTELKGIKEILIKPFTSFELKRSLAASLK